MQDSRIDSYLRKSTRGLWGRKKAEVREELESHLQGRINSHLIAGLNESDAIEKTLTELGQPTNVSAGMARLYTLPIVAGSGMMVAMCCALVVVLLSGSTAQTLQVTNIFPANECLESKTPASSLCTSQGLWMGTKELQEALEPQGVTITKKYNLMVLEFPDKKTFPISSSAGSIFINDKMLYPQPGYVTLGELLKGLTSRRDTAIAIDGWEVPVISIGQVSLQMIKDDKPIGGLDFYASYIWTFASTGLMNLGKLLPDGQSIAFMTYLDDAMSSVTHSKRFNVGAKEGTVYAVATLQKGYYGATEGKNEDVNLTFYFDVAPAFADGTVSLHVPKEFEFDGSSLDVGKAVLLRLSGKFPEGQFYEVIPPEQISLE
jgi:hypothetical protein